MVVAYGYSGIENQEEKTFKGIAKSLSGNKFAHLIGSTSC